MVGSPGHGTQEAVKGFVDLLISTSVMTCQVPESNHQAAPPAHTDRMNKTDYVIMAYVSR